MNSYWIFSTILTQKKRIFWIKDFYEKTSWIYHGPSSKRSEWFQPHSQQNHFSKRSKWFQAILRQNHLSRRSEWFLPRSHQNHRHRRSKWFHTSKKLAAIFVNGLVPKTPTNEKDHSDNMMFLLFEVIKTCEENKKILKSSHAREIIHVSTGY